MCTFRSFGSAMTPDKFCRFIGLDWRYLPDAADVQLLYSLHWLLPVSAFEILRDFGRFSLDAFDFIQNIWKILKAEVQNWRGFFEDSLGIFSHSPEFYGRVLSVILLETLSSFEIDTRIHTHTHLYTDVGILGILGRYWKDSERVEHISVSFFCDLFICSRNFSS